MEVVLLSLLITIIALIFTYKHKTTHKINYNLPPGSLGWPFLGETLEFLYGNPNKFIEDRMKKYSNKVFKTKILGEPTIVLCGVNGNKFLAANDEKLVRGWRPYSMQKLFRSYQTVESATTPRETEVHFFRGPGFLRIEALVKYTKKIGYIVQEHLKTHWKESESVEVYKLVKLLTTTLASELFLGLYDDRRIMKLSGFMEGMSIGLHSIPLNIPGTVFYRAKLGADEIKKEIVSLIKEKREALARGVEMNDILSFMIRNSDPNGGFVSDSEIADKAMGLLVAGFSAPTTAITFLMKFTGENPQIYNKILIEQMKIKSCKKSGNALEWEDLQKMKYSWNVALEVMRLIPPLQGTFREAITDFTFEGFTIPRGWKVYWTVSTTNKNPDYFPDPENFDPSRYEKRNGSPPYTNVPFGGGPRICPGKEYARTVMLIFLHYIVATFKWETLDPNEKIIGSMIPIPAKGLPIRLQPHPV